MNSATGSSIAFFILLVAVSITTVMADSEPPPRPKISETFESQFVYVADNVTVSGSMIRDLKGGRQVINSSTGYFTFTRIDLADMNMSYAITWNETTGNITCEKSEFPVSIGMMWDWVQYAEYIGRDEFDRIDMWFNESIYTGLAVSTYNPNTPVVLSNSYIDTVFIGFNPMYIPVDSDFNVPDDCISKKVNKKQSFDDRFPHMIFASEYLNRKFAAKPFPQGTENEHFKRHRSMFGSRGKNPKM